MNEEFALPDFFRGKNLLMMRKNQDIADSICQAIERIKSRSPAFDNILEAFGELIIARACFKAQLPLPDTDETFRPDPLRFSQGLHLLAEKMPVFDRNCYLKAADSLFPPMEKGFPKIARDIHAVKRAIENQQLSPEMFMPGLPEGEDAKHREIIAELNIKPQVLQFIIGEIMKPFLEKQAEALSPLIQELQWHKGYCPICGSYPELSILQGQSGERYLRCAVCAYQWRFIRTECPACENEKIADIEVIFFEQSPHERAELCRSCKKYLIAFDLRKYPHAIVFDVERLGALYLDIIAQERGYFPIAGNAWNVPE